MKTSKLKDVIYELGNVAEYEFTPTYFKHLDNACVEICDKLDELQVFKDKQEQGLLISLPCKVGDIVYLIKHCMVECKKKPIECVVDELTINGSGCHAILSGNEVFYAMQRFSGVSIEDFGKTVFVTRSEAESALAKMGGK